MALNIKFVIYGAFTAVFGLAALGCSGGGFGESVVVAPDRWTKVDAGFTSGKSVVLPEEQGFNLTGAQRHSSGGGQAASFAHADGTAGCEVSVDKKGDARAEFQLGQAVHNASDQPLEVVVQFDCEYEYAVAGGDDGPPARSPSTLVLKLYVRDSNASTLHSEILASRADALGAHRRGGRDTPTFHVTLEPNLTYDLVLAGVVEVKAEEEDLPAIKAQITVKKLAIEVHAQ